MAWKIALCLMMPLALIRAIEPDKVRARSGRDSIFDWVRGQASRELLVPGRPHFASYLGLACIQPIWILDLCGTSFPRMAMLDLCASGISRMPRGRQSCSTTLAGGTGV